MKAIDLRLGNFVLHNGRVVEITMARYIEDFNDGKIELLPIPLTEEWLVNFGAEKDGDCFNLHGLKMYYENGIGSYYHINNELIIYLDFVHQLQNFYFVASNGEELTIK